MKSGKTISMQTKVTPETHARMEKLVHMGGFDSSYELLQYLITVFLRYADPEGEGAEVRTEDNEMARWAEMFADWDKVSSRILTTSTRSIARTEIDTAIIISSYPRKGGYVGKMIKWRGGEIATSGNVNSMINNAIRTLRPKLAEELMQIARSCGTRSYVEAIEALLEDTSIVRTKATVFGDGAEGDGDGYRQNEYGNVPVRHNNHFPKP